MSWILSEKSFDKDKIVQNGNKFLIGNGYLGYRGTLDEFGTNECVALNIAGVYDGLKGKWRETVNAFNPFLLRVDCDGALLDVQSGNVLCHEHSLNLQNGVFSRKTTFVVERGTIQLYSERFCSMAVRDLLASRVQICADFDCEIVIRAGIDGDVWDLNGPHLVDTKFFGNENMVAVTAFTQERRIPLTVRCEFSCAFEHCWNGIAQFRVSLKKDVPFTLDRFARIFVGECGEDRAIDYEAAFSESEKVWRSLWKNADVVMKGDERAQFALRYSIYHLLILAPKGDYSIAARGISGQTYKGAVFWDTEMFLLPFYLATDSKCAERLVRYRIQTLPDARKKAADYGYDGAFYAWESQDGYDACSDYNVTDVFTHRPVRTFFKDKQIHISADVAYAVYSYYERTGDEELLFCGGLETMLACSEFYYSYSYYSHTKKRYELLDVLGPDEYHERVNNNAYTNYLAHFIAVKALEVCSILQMRDEKRTAEILQKFREDLTSDLHDWVENLYLPRCGEKGVLEQFDGYFRHEDVTVETVRSRLVVPNEYWGGSTGVATATRVIKQADVVMLLDLLPEYFPQDALKANYEFYLPYTEHGSSLSACMYALAACRIGKTKEAWEWFLKTAEIDLVGGGKQWAGEIYIGGTHPAANGGAWLTAVAGFAGLAYRNGEMTFMPALPEPIEEISFTAMEKGTRYAVTVTRNGVKKRRINEI